MGVYFYTQSNNKTGSLFETGRKGEPWGNVEEAGMRKGFSLKIFQKKKAENKDEIKKQKNKKR